jgi:large subunit ribosomal protein L47
MDPTRRSKVQVDEDHGLWDFFNRNRTPVQTPEELHAHGRGWTIQELRSKSWDDLHRLWWMCIKDVNRCMTSEAERSRLDAGYGEYEKDQRLEEVSFD